MRCDVCLILEGTYPYVAGGVSTWVAQIIEYMPDISFGIIYLAATSKDKLTLKYDLPVNVTEVREVYLYDFPKQKSFGYDHILSDAEWKEVEVFQRAIIRGEPLNVVGISKLVQKPQSIEAFMQEFAYSHKSWDAAMSLYNESFDALGLLDFFWSYRIINLPLLKLLRTRIIPAKIYHTACTGYASALGALYSRITGSPLLISEHGIYTRERRIDVFDADWICGESYVPRSLDMSRKSNHFKEWWVNLFMSLSRTAYNNAQQIFSLFQANKRDQVADGAEAERVRIIPNGIELSDFLAITPRVRGEADKFVIGYVGRIAPIKDVKTLIKSLDHLKRFQVNFKALLMGPYDEDVQYYQECRELVERLDLSAEVEFTGRVKVTDKLGEIDVGVISSISEGLPFAILEAGGAGVPFVATDVGACRELIEGGSDEDRALGKGGYVVSVSSPKELALALKKVADSTEEAARMGQILRERVSRYYNINEVMNQYRDEYRKCFEKELLYPKCRIRPQSENSDLP